MNRQEIELMVAILFCFIIPMVAIIYYRIRHRKHYERKSHLIFLRINNPDVRKQIWEADIKLCPCAREFSNTYLYTTDGSIVCGFNENHRHLIADAAKRRDDIVDCGINVDKFIQEVKNYDAVDKETI